MMNRLKQIFCWLLLYGMTNISAQNNEQQAYQIFKQARESYDAGQYETAIKQLQETIILLGEPKLRIQPMYVNSLMKVQDWREAKTQLNIYFNLNPDQSLVEYQQMRAAEREVLAKISAEDTDYRAAKASPSQSAFQNYLNNWPYGIYRSEVSQLLSNQKDDDAWKAATNSRTTAAYFTYLDAYPSGRHAAEALSTIERWDKEAYEKAISTATQESYQYYLDNYPRGGYRDSISDLLADKQDDDYYASVKNTNTIEAYEGYVSRYPSGNHANEANQIIQNSYFNWSENEIKAKNYDRARTYLQTLDSRYPTGKYASEVNRLLRKTDRKLAQQGAGWIMFTYDAISNYGFSFGRLDPHRMTMYANLRLDPDILVGYDVIYKIDDTGENTGPWDLLIPTGNQTDNANINLSIGFAFNLLYPLWFYVGGGAGYYPLYTEYDAYTENWAGNLVYSETEYFRNTDRSNIRLFPEAGVYLKAFDALILKYGVMYNSNMIYHQLGAGIKVGR